MTRAETRDLWEAVDWSLPDKEVGRRRAVVALWRARLAGQAPSRCPGLAFAAYVRAHRDELHGLRTADVIARAGTSLSPGRARVALRAAGVRKYTTPTGPPRPPEPFPPVNWALPNTSLAAAWGISPGTVCKVRFRRKAPRAKWLRGRPGDLADPAYLAAAERERAGAVPRPAGERGRP